MRTSGLPNFKKLWGKINTDLTPGTYKILAKNNYNSSGWNGNRYVILTTIGAIGGKNFLLPISFLLVGVISIIAVIIFWRRYNSFKSLHI
jgi:hypothetical protein